MRASGTLPNFDNEGMERTVISRGWLAPAVLGAAATLGAAALYTSRKTHEAEHKYPPVGRFLSVDGVRLHYIERGTGEPLLRSSTATAP